MDESSSFTLYGVYIYYQHPKGLAETWNGQFLLLLRTIQKVFHYTSYPTLTYAVVLYIQGSQVNHSLCCRDKQAQVKSKTDLILMPVKLCQPCQVLTSLEYVFYGKQKVIKPALVLLSTECQFPMMPALTLSIYYSVYRMPGTGILKAKRDKIWPPAFK